MKKMIDFKEIEQNYRKMPLGKLKKIATEPEKFKREVILILKEELKRRGEKEDVAFLSDYLQVLNEKSRIHNMSKDELKKLVKERLDSGENQDSIMSFLKNHGINIFDIIGSDNSKIEKENIKKRPVGATIMAILYFLAFFGVLLGIKYNKNSSFVLNILQLFFIGIGLWEMKKWMVYTGIVFFGLLQIFLIFAGLWQIKHILPVITIGITLSFVDDMD